MIKKIKNSGFTLIELLVVIAIIGVLASIVLVSLGGARAKASASKAKSDLAQIMTAIELYQSDNGNVGNIAVGTCANPAADGDGTFDTAAVAGNEVDTVDHFAAGRAANDDLCTGRVFSSDADAPVPSTVYLQVLPAPPANYTYELAAVPSGTSYSVQADGFTDDTNAEFICTNGSCYCDVSNMCQK